jgi:DNA-binding transcriptional LysR family regulator
LIHLRHIEVFYAIMRAGSVTDAARVLNVTQPAVSAALKQLEARLKLQLFDRTGGRFQPTAEAKALLPDIAEIFGRLSAVERYSQDLAGGTRGVLAIAATTPLCDGFVAKAVASFLKSRPAVKITLQSAASPVVLDRVINREVDLGVVYEPVVTRAVRMDAIGKASIVCVLPARHRLAKRAALRLSDLEHEKVITYLPQALLRPYIDRALSSSRSPLHIAVETSTSATAIMLAVHGAGIALIESSFFAARPVAGFVMRPLEPRIELKSLLLRPLRGSTSRVVTDFLAHLSGAFA